MYTNRSIYAYVSWYVYLHISCAHVYICTRMHVYIHMCMIDLYVQIYISCTCIYTYIYIYIYMHIFKLRGPKLHLTSLCAHICLKPLNIQSNLDRYITCTHVVLKRSLSYKHYIYNNICVLKFSFLLRYMFI